MTFDAKFTIGTYWSAVITSSANKHYVMTNESWDGAIAPGASVAMGFNATPGKPAAPTGVIVQVNGGTANAAAVPATTTATTAKAATVTTAAKTATTKKT